VTEVDKQVARNVPPPCTPSKGGENEKCALGKAPDCAARERTYWIPAVYSGAYRMRRNDQDIRE